jgi:2-aminoethylphosphonate transport system permease protein
VATSVARPAAPPTDHKPRSASGALLWVVPPLLILVGVVGYPLVMVVRESFLHRDGPLDAGSLTAAGYTGLLSSPTFLDALLTTVKVAAAATIGCLVLGAAIAIVVSLVPFPGAGAVARVIDTVVAFPSFLITLSLAFLYGGAGLLTSPFGLPDLTGTWWALVVAEITFYTPFVIRPLLAAFSQLDPALLEAAASLGARPGRVLRRIVLPEALPALLAGGSLCLLLTLNEFGIVLFLGVKGVQTLPVLVYSYAVLGSSAQAGTAAAVAVINTLLSLALYLVYRAALSRIGGRRAGVV